MQVIQMYEQNHWGWPSKESPEEQLPGDWHHDQRMEELKESDDALPMHRGATGATWTDGGAYSKAKKPTKVTANALPHAHRAFGVMLMRSCFAFCKGCEN